MTIEDLTGEIVSAARANHIPYIQAQVANALSDGPKTNQEVFKMSIAPSAALRMQENHTCLTTHADVAREVQSALAALQSAGNGSCLLYSAKVAPPCFVTVRTAQVSLKLCCTGVAAQLFGAEVLLALASSGDKDRWDMLVQQKAASIVCERVASGKLQVSFQWHPGQFAFALSSMQLARAFLQPVSLCGSAGRGMCICFESFGSTGQRAGTPGHLPCCRLAPSPQRLHSEHARPAEQHFSAGVSEAAGSSAADNSTGKL